MVERKYRCLAISDFNTSTFNGYLTNDEQLPLVEVIEAPYGQVTQVLLAKDQGGWEKHPDFVVAWTRPEIVSRSFNLLLQGEPVSLDTILSEVDEYASLLVELEGRVEFAFVPTWVLPPYRRCFLAVEMRTGVGMDNTLMRMNLRLAEKLEKVPTIIVLNAHNWIGLSGKTGFSSKLWYMSKIPFENSVFKDAATTMKSALRGILGKSKKLVVLDLDDTLWGGIVGEQGWQNLRLGGHDPVGEACVDFQRELKSLANRGILLAIVSKNEESVALEAIRNHPEMVLRLEDFAGWRINWLDKASNMVDLVSSLNLGLDSVVFIDDNPVERKRVSEALSQVFVPDWPEDKMLYKAALQGLSCFEGPVVTQEDRSRTRMYAAEKVRASSQVSFLSLDEWLESLGTVVTCEPLNQSNLPRANQLLNKTNQMNLSTRRMSEQALLAWANENNRRLWVFRLKDKFGDLGLTGLLSLEHDTTKARIVDFILSCRVMGRKIEETMLAKAIEAAQSLGAVEVFAQYIATEKNKPCLEFLKRSAFRYCEDGQTFHWDTKMPYPIPKQIHFEFAE